MTIRLLYLTREPYPSFRPDLATLFGQSLPAHGVFSDLVALRDGNQASEWPAGRVYARQANGRFGRVVTRLRLAFDLFALSGQKDYSAIQVRDRIVGACIGMAIARWRGIPFFYWMSFPFPEAWQDLGSGQAATTASWLQRLYWRYWGRIAGWLLYAVVLPRAAHVFVQSDAMLEMLVDRGLPAEHMTPVPMGVALPANPELIVPSDDSRLKGRRVIVYLGALERIRHPEIMLEAMVAVAQQAPDALLVLVGDSQTSGERMRLAGEIERLGLGRHAFITGWLARKEALGYLCAATIGLSPIPRTRLFDVASPTKVCEYLAYGLPVVANDQPDQAFLLRETGGGLCVSMTAEGFALGILELLADPLRARRMAEAGIAQIARLRSYDVLGEFLSTRYRKLLKAQFSA